MRETKITPLYERLSRDDGDDKESNSISTQKNLLEQYAKNMMIRKYEQYLTFLSGKEQKS